MTKKEMSNKIESALDEAVEVKFLTKQDKERIAEILTDPERFKKFCDNFEELCGVA